MLQDLGIYTYLVHVERTMTYTDVYNRNGVSRGSTLVPYLHSRTIDQLKHNSEIVGTVVSSIFQISKDQIFSPHRGKASVAFARQIAMYLTHITCGHSYTDIGDFFGRDRTTVSHACQLIEDKREDPAIDWSLDLMEHSVLSLIKQFQKWNG
jgi:hypothetical protein